MNAIAAWESEERLTAEQAIRLREELAQPQFVAVLPHFGVHLAIGAVLRFPIGSMVRVSYVLANLLLATLRLLVRNIDRHVWHQAIRIHSPLVLLISGMPGIGTFAYLASKPMRSNHLLVRVGVDAVLLKLPRHVYERIGLRWVIALPSRTESQTLAATEKPLQITVWPPNVVLILAMIVGALSAADALVVIADTMLHPSIPGWEYINRILDLNAESSLGTWYAGASLILLSGLLFSIAIDKLHSGDRYGRHWLVLAFLPLGFSIDEQAKLHDPGGLANSVRDRLPLSGPLYTGWVIFGIISVIVVAMLFKGFLLDLPQSTRRLYMLAAALFIAGELVFEMMSGWYLDRSGSEDFVYQILTTFEESLSMAGIFVAIAATLHYIQVHLGEVRIALHGIRPAVEGVQR
ncbi:MAG TPA: hypothetical protein VFV93_17990 [Thermomicrobiales bacterium]|nr:hypothetical protein [Thermomicrobiales bacterium]